MSIKFFCNFCERELHPNLDESTEENMTLAEARRMLCTCEDCIPKMLEAEAKVRKHPLFSYFYPGETHNSPCQGIPDENTIVLPPPQPEDPS